MSTSTLGREERKPMVDAFVFERRVLLGCTGIIGAAIVLWIVAISTDHWITVSGGEGIYIPETRRFFKSSHAGLWKRCRNVIEPKALSHSEVFRNLSYVSLTNSSKIAALKQKTAVYTILDDLIKEPLPENITEIDDNFKQHLFVNWVRDTSQFPELKRIFKNITSQPVYMHKKKLKPIMLDPRSNKTALEQIDGVYATTVSFNDTFTNIVYSEDLHNALFTNWDDTFYVLPLLYAFSIGLEIPIPIVKDGKNFILRPPTPPRRLKTAHGYEYIPSTTCQSEMVKSPATLNAPEIDEDLLDYNRTEASFACIALIIMLMGFFFSIYTFLNPRYMFKRLAGGIHFISACSTFVVLQVTAHGAKYEQEHLTTGFPDGATYAFGYGFWMAYLVFAMNILSSIMFFLYSKKRKGNKAPTEELGMADEPIQIGR